MQKYLFILIALFIGTSIKAQDFKIIVNNSNTVSTLSKKEVSDFLLKKDTKWGDGQKVVPVDQKANSELRKEISGEIHGKSVGAIKSYWQQAVFAGKGTPPVEKDSDAEVVNYVQNNIGAIGYVSVNADVSGVKVVSIN